MVLTGWTSEQLGRQPAPVVRRLMHRVFVAAAWNPEIAAVARELLPAGADPAARIAKWEAQQDFAVVEAALFPEDA